MPFIRYIIRATSFLALATGCAVAAEGADEIDLASYEWRASISGALTSGTVYRAALNADIYDGCRSFPLDLKVIDRDGSVYPSIVRADRRHEEVVPLRIVPVHESRMHDDVGYVSSGYNVFPSRPDQVPAVHNRAIVELRRGEHFRRAQVWGGEDETSLELLGSGILVERSSPFDMRNRSIDYPDSTAPYVEVRIFDDKGDDTQWRATDIVRVLHEQREDLVVEVKVVDRPADHTEREGITSVYLDTGARHRPLKYIDLDTSGGTFSIPVRVHGRNDEQKEWRWVADGGIVRMGKLSGSRIDLHDSDYRFLRADLYHDQQEMPRVKGATAEVVPYALYFTARSDGRAHVYFGSAYYLLPAAELSSRFVGDLRAGSVDISLSRRHANPAKIAHSLNRYGHTLLTFGVGILVLFGALIGIRMIRKRVL